MFLLQACHCHVTGSRMLEPKPQLPSASPRRRYGCNARSGLSSLPWPWKIAVKIRVGLGAKDRLS